MTHHSYTLFACWVTFFWILSVRAVYVTLVPAISLELGLSASQGGILLGVFFMLYSGTVWLSGYVHGHRKAVVLAGIAVSLLGIALTAAARSYGQLLLFPPIMSVGLAWYFPRAISLIVESAPPGTEGRGIGIHEMAANAGNVVGPLYASLSIVSLSWRYVLFIWGLLGILAWLVFSRVKENPTSRPPGGVPGRLRAHRRFVEFVSLGGICVMLIMGYVAALPLLMVHGWGLEPAQAASFVGLTRVLAMAGPLIAGFGSDRLDRYKLIAILLGVSALAMAAMVPLGFGTGFWIATMAMTAASAGAIPVYFTVLAESYSGESRDQAVAVVVGFASFMGGVVAPVLFGALIEHYPPAVTLGVAALWAVAGVVLAIRLRAGGSSPPARATLAR